MSLRRGKREEGTKANGSGVAEADAAAEVRITEDRLFTTAKIPHTSL